MTTNATGTAATATETATEQAPVSVFDRMLGFLESEEKGPAQDEATAPEGSETAPEGVEGAEAEGDEGTELPDEADADAGSEGDEADESQPADQLYTVRVDGKEEQVGLSELLAGYSRTSDYTRKTQEVAAHRKEVDALRGELVQERQEYAVLLPKLRAMLEGDAQEPNWEALRRANPMQALLEKQRWDERQKQVADLRAEEERVATAEEQRLIEERKQHVAREREAMRALPEFAHWHDAEKRKADANLIAQTLLAAGFSEQDLAITDHRAMRIAYKAALYDKEQAAKAKAKDVVAGKVKQAPTMKAGAAPGKPKTAVSRAVSRLARTGSRDDAAAFFLASMK
jgi:hypothetical protein